MSEMEEAAKIRKISLPEGKRVICVSDIHGSLDLFKRLLRKVRYARDDVLILLGDFYTKGAQGHETLKYVIELCRSPDVYALRGNCDWIESYLDSREAAWLESLPHVLEAKDYIFVHGGLTSEILGGQAARSCMKYDAFMEKGLSFRKYVVTGHWPTFNYCHTIPCCNPIIDEANRIIAIDGGISLLSMGQLNAFIITQDAFSFDTVDDLPAYQCRKSQSASGGTVNITWKDRHVELIGESGGYSAVRHMRTGLILTLPSGVLWIDYEGHLCGCSFGTDHCLAVHAGDTVSVVQDFGDRFFAKKDGVLGWVMTKGIIL